MSINTQWNELFEDKKCRICGLADMNNINIFNDKILRMKIGTVYPIVLQPDDPLPRNICRKCVSTVSSMYNDIQRVIKLQNKWTQNVRSNEPQNSFLQTMNLLQNATEAIKNLINATYSKTLSTESINRLITTALSKVEQQENTADPETIETLPLNGDKYENEKIKEEPTNDEYDDDENLALSEIAGSTKSSLDVPPPLKIMCQYCSKPFDSLKSLLSHQSIHMRLRIPRMFQTKFLGKKSRRGRLISINDRQSIRCLNCWRIFDDNKCILDHWSKAECEFYCQICGKEYEPKQLREHVLVAHNISYKSFKAQRDRLMRTLTTSSKPKQQTDFKSNKSLRSKNENLTLSLPQVAHTQNNEETSNCTPKAAPRQSRKLVTCRICSRAFQNFKACNSHMRAHKPPYAYGETAPLPDVDADAYIETEKKNLQSKSPLPNDSQNTKSETVSNSHPTITTTPVKISTNSIPCSTETPKEHELGLNMDIETKFCATLSAAPSQATAKMPTSNAPRGIRMKFVSRRSDLNGPGPSIKVKSLSDLQGGQQHSVMSNRSPIVNKVQNDLPPTSPLIPIKASLISPNIKDEPLDSMLL